MKDYSNVSRYFGSQLWAIRPEMLGMMGEIVNMRLRGETFTAEEIQARIGAARNSAVRQSGAIAVLPLYGVIDQKVGSMTQVSGGTAVNAFMESFREAMADESVSAIIFDVDSPGGSVAGIPEAANEIYNARGKKPIIAVADPTIASAAYWLSCAADEIICMPSGQVGSIGVLSVHGDYSKANEIDGYKPTYITYGQFKAEANSDSPLSEDAQAYTQGQVNQMGDIFTRFVGKARGVSVDTVRSSFGQGRMLMAKEALAAGMIDSVGTLDQAIVKVQRTPATVAQDDATPLIAETDFSTLGEVSKQVLVGLNDTVSRWNALVERHGESLTNAKRESILALQAGVRDASANVEAIISRMEQPPSASTEPSTEEPDLQSLLEFERARFEFLSQ